MKKACVETKSCVACGVCRKACPKQAVSIYKGCFAKVDETLCIGCRMCEKKCPAGAIKVREIG